MLNTNPPIVADVDARMRSQFDEARAAAKPVGMLHVTVDRLERATPEQRQQRLAALGRLLEERPAADFVVGATPEGQVVLVVGLDRAELEEYARGLLRAGRKRGPLISIGVAHVQGRGEVELDTLRRVTDAGLEVARRGGGNRLVHTDQYASVGARVVERAVPLAEPAPSAPDAPDTSDEQGALAQVQLERTPATPATAPAAPTEAATEAALIDVLRKALTGDSTDPRLAKFQTALEDLLREHPEKDPANERVDILERRVQKLAAALDLAEGEIRRLHALKPGESPGVSSIYREVQGLSAGEPLEALKRELMARIFEANRELQGARRSE